MANYTDRQIEDLIIPCIGNTPVTCLTLFGDHFTRPFCSVHNSIFKVLDNDEIRLSAIAAPRGFGKTTTIGLGFVGRKALFREAPYIVYISSTATEAAAKVKTLAKELQENEVIKDLFGDLKGIKWAEEKGEIELSDENGAFCFIQAKGAGSQIRGLKWGKHRPSLFVVDDLEDPEEVCNEVIRQKLKEWFFADLLGARDQSADGKTRIIVIGTILHEAALLAELIDESNTDEDGRIIGEDAHINLKEQFVTLRLEACDDEFHSVWPEYLSDEALKAKAAAYERRGLLDVFYREWRNIVIAKDNAAFQKSMFRYYSEQIDRELLEGVETIILVDPAKTANTASAYTAVCAVGFDSVRNRIYFRDAVNAKLTPEKIYETAFDMADRFNSHIIGCEETGLNNFIMYPFQQAAAQRRRWVEVRPIKALKDKALRVSGLVYFYRVGAIWHNEDLHVRGTLETQLLSFPRSKYWDMMDCFANCIEMFELGDRNFSMNSIDVFDLEGNQMNEFAAFELEDKLEREVEFRII